MKEQFRTSTLYLGDCRDILPEIDQEVQAVITDPPYGISYHTNWRKIRETPEMLLNDVTALLWSVQLMYEKLEDGGAMYLCTRFDVAHQWQKAMRDVGAKIKTPIVWDKGNWTSGDLTGDYGNQCELILFAHKGRHKLKDGRPSNLWRVPREPAGDHPTPKPVELMARCIHNSVNKGGFVLGPFMGTGSTGVAAIKNGCKFIGIELDTKYFDIACRRIENEEKQVSLFDFI